MESLIVFLPLIAAIYVGLQTASISIKKSQMITAGAVSIAAILSVVLFFDVTLGGNARTIDLFTWLNVGDLKASWQLKIDSLTATMLLLVTIVSALVHIYSIGYMSHDKHPQRFMAYLSLFTFFMLMLVTSGNLVQLFLGWEGVGLCSYLLIGFWFKKESANNASMKAFIVNRVGDFGMVLGIFACYAVFGSVEFDVIFAQIDLYANDNFSFAGLDIHAISLIAILLFIGAMGKSAQLGLHSWLPDAMEGPTPVSALIHAATMVTAGVFLLARMSPLYEYASEVLTFVAILGAITCLVAASIALVQNDIKRVIAYSTMSQLGYMFFACGVGAYAAGVFHLFTHGFFKALLFLGAGSVIHASSDEQDMRKMGGLWNKIPITYTVMILGTLAITGFPLLAGFWSKDMILESAFAVGGYGETVYWIGIVAAMFTSFYSWRLIMLTFHGKSRASEEVQKHVHESPRIMTTPLIILAFGAVFIGAIGALWWGMVDPSLAFWGDAIVMNGQILEDAHYVPLYIKLMPLIVGLIGLFVAFIFYIKKTDLPGKLASKLKVIHKILFNKYYIDELYERVFVRPLKAIGTFFWKIGDTRIIDGAINGIAALSGRVSGLLSRIQSGFVYHYVLVMILALTGFITYIIWGNL